MKGSRNVFALPFFFFFSSKESNRFVCVYEHMHVCEWANDALYKRQRSLLRYIHGSQVQLTQDTLTVCVFVCTHVCNPNEADFFKQEIDDGEGERRSKPEPIPPSPKYVGISSISLSSSFLCVSAISGVYPNHSSRWSVHSFTSAALNMLSTTSQQQKTSLAVTMQQTKIGLAMRLAF